MDTVCGKVNRSLNLLCRLSWFLPRSFLFTFLKINPTFSPISITVMLSGLVVILVNLVD